MKRFNILVDIDGIVADTLPKWLARIHEKTGVLATFDDIVNWDMSKNGPLTALDPREIFGILNEPGFNLAIQPLNGASLNLKLLQDAGHKIYFTTARYGNVCMPETLHWMRVWMPWVNPEKQIAFIYEKTLIEGDVFIDDKAETLAAYRQRHPAANLMTISYPYNQQTIDGLYRVPYDTSAWTKLRERIEALANDNTH